MIAAENKLLEPSSIRTFKVCEIENAMNRQWGTSGKYLQSLARCIHQYNQDDNQESIRLSIVEDIYTKSWSYAWINKVAFWFSIFFGLLTIVWPALASIIQGRKQRKFRETYLENDTSQGSSDGLNVGIFSSPSAQTAVAALAAVSFAFYAHYKDKQAISENLMRVVLYSEDFTPELRDNVIEKILEIDKGFQFATHLDAK